MRALAQLEQGDVLLRVREHSSMPGPTHRPFPILAHLILRALSLPFLQIRNSFTREQSNL
jgi:hypothetical protein